MAGTFWPDFWPSFWSDLIATIIAIVAGVPIALWINRLNERREAASRAEEAQRVEEQRLADERERTAEALAQFEPVIRSQVFWFRTLTSWSNLNEYHEGPLAEVWAVLRHQIVGSHLTDKKLFGDLANHFERCIRMDELVRLRSSIALVGPPAQQEQWKIDREAINTRLNNMRNAEDAKPEVLAERVAAEIVQLRRKG